MGMHDGVSKLWVVRANEGLDVDGYKDESEAIGALIRQALSFGPLETRAKIEAAVAKALTHLDEKPKEDDES